MFAWINFAVLIFASIFIALLLCAQRQTGSAGESDRVARLSALLLLSADRLWIRTCHHSQLYPLLLCPAGHSTLQPVSLAVVDLAGRRRAHRRPGYDPDADRRARRG